MKKRFYVFAALICCLFFSIPARADVIVEPADYFYAAHANECKYVGRTFTANGPDGKVILYKSPELPEVVTVWENGQRAYIYFTYRDQDGIEWGIYDDHNGTMGWMPMAYMEVVYDSIAFQEEHRSQITEQFGELDEKYQGQDIFLWRYPGSLEYNYVTFKDDPPTYNHVYVDENENSWGLIDYWYGSRDVWICLDAPNADLDQLYPDGAPVYKTPKTFDTPKEDIVPSAPDSPEADVVPSVPDSPTETPRIVPKAKPGIIPLTIFMVVSIMAATAILLVILKGKKK